MAFWTASNGILDFSWSNSVALAFENILKDLSGPWHALLFHDHPRLHPPLDRYQNSGGYGQCAFLHLALWLTGLIQRLSAGIHS